MSENGLPPIFDADFQHHFLDLLEWRRDVRHFKTDPLPEGMLEDLLTVANLAPSVGLSQPWRFVVVEDADRRAAITANFEKENAAALGEYDGDKAKTYATLKLSGLNDAPVQLAVFCDPDPEQGAGLGRRTMPETLAYSCTMAIHTLWLYARTKGLGLGWVSILTPDFINDALDVPDQWQFIGYFCLGYPQSDDNVPELQRRGWENRHAPEILKR